MLFDFPESQLSVKGVILFMLLFSIDSTAQEAECGYLTTEKGLKNRTIRKSKNPIVFKVTEEVSGQLIFTNSGYPNTLMAEFKFDDVSGYLVDLGTILAMNFADGTHTDFIADSKRSFTSVAYFTLLKPANKRAKKVMAFEDRILYEKLIQTNLTSVDYSIDNKKKRLTVSDSNSEIIKKTIACLIFSSKNEEN